MKQLFRCFFAVAFVVFSPVAAEEEPKPNLEQWGTFKRLLMEKRLYQLGAVKQLLGKNREQQLRTIKAAMTKMKQVMTESRIILEPSGIINLDNKRLPDDSRVREALALIVENTCFASDFLLRFPDDVRDLLALEPDLDVIYRWGLGFVENIVTTTTSDLFDDGTRRLLDLSLMEMGLKEKSDDYHNTYARPKRSETKKKMDFVDPPAAPPTKKPRKKIARGPRMSRAEL